LYYYLSKFNVTIYTRFVMGVSSQINEYNNIKQSTNLIHVWTGNLAYHMTVDFLGSTGLYAE